MKKNKIYILAAAAALLALAGCAKDPGPGNGGEITVEASIGATKVSTVGDNSAFEANDRIAVYAWTGGATAVPDSRVVDGVVNTLGSDGKWAPATKMIWGSMTTPHYFLGISPVPAAIADFTAASFTLDPSPAAYTTSDLLVATNFGTGNAGLTAADGAVLLAFEHVMAKLNVNLKFRSEWDSAPTVSSVTVTAKTAATVNYLTKTATVDATAAAGEVPLNELSTPATGYGRSYSSLQVPQAIRAFTVIIDGKKYEYASTDDIVLTGGRYTTVNFIVGRDRIELDGITVAPWATDDVEHPEGDVELKHAAPGWHTYCESEFENAYRSNVGKCSWGYEYPVDLLLEYSGFTLTKVSLFSDTLYGAGAVAGNFTCNIYVGGDTPGSGTLASTITVDVPAKLGAWVDFPLTTPVPISGDEPVWVIWSENEAAGLEYPAGCVDHSSEYGSWWSDGQNGWEFLNGHTWTMRQWFSDDNGVSLAVGPAPAITAARRASASSSATSARPAKSPASGSSAESIASLHPRTK
ncbi:MAG: fimbrillin family protein [Bacteroidales bacterium]|nr:fimbrillin family protein [Bacteroidales bacterium]